jgi:Cys-tRNA(Pro) deacylase
MKEDVYPMTSAVRVLKENSISFVPYLYTYEEHGGTHQFAEKYTIPEHHVIKTLVFETDKKKPFLVLMHGDCEVSAKQLARTLGVKEVHPCDASAALRHTGYQFGGTSPLGTRNPLPVYVEKTILNLQKIYINGGKRGFIVELVVKDILQLCSAIEVQVSIPHSY